MGIEKFHNLACIGYMFFHSERQSFEALQDIECSGGTHTGAEVSGTFLACSRDVGCRAKLFGKVESVKPVIGLCECWKFTRLDPVKFSTVNQHPADHHTVATQELGC